MILAYALIALIVLPLAIGFGFLLGYLDGDNPGWAWWPALFGFAIAGAYAVAVICVLIWSIIRLAVSRLGVDLDRTVVLVFEWIGKFIGYLVVAGIFVWIAIEFFDAIDTSSHKEIIFFVLGGWIVYVFLDRNR